MVFLIQLFLIEACYLLLNFSYYFSTFIALNKTLYRYLFIDKWLKKMAE